MRGRAGGCRAPGPVELVGVGLGDVEGHQLHEGDPPRQRLAARGEQVDRGGAQQQEPARPLAFPPAPVDRAAQRFEDAGGAVNLVEDDQLVSVVGEVELRLGQPRPVGLGPCNSISLLKNYKDIDTQARN